MRTGRLGLVLALSAVVVAGSVWLIYTRTDGARRTKARYIKDEYRIPMRNGVTLFTQVYLPRDKTKTYPILVQSSNWFAASRCARDSGTPSRVPKLCSRMN